MKAYFARHLGRLLRSVRAGEHKLAIHDPSIRHVPQTMTLSSDWFADRSYMPRISAGKGVGDNLSPPLSWAGVPEGTEGFLLVIEDCDVPLKRPFVHLISFGIERTSCSIEADQLAAASPLGAPYGVNSSGDSGYRGPRALRGHGDHRYVFQLFALAKQPTIPEKATLDAVLRLNSVSILASAVLIGLYRQD